MSRKHNNQRQTSRPPQPVGKQTPSEALSSEIDPAIRTYVQEALVSYFEYFTGPLPHPEHLAEYERTTPGAAERIIGMAEAQAEHRRVLEAKVVDSNVRLESQGQIFGLVIGMTALIGGIGLMAFGKSITGVATSPSALSALVGLFIWSKRQKKRELSEEANPPKPPSGPG